MSLATECESCGRPMATREDHGGLDPDNPYCNHCTDLKGRLLPFQKKFEDFVDQAMQTRWMTREKAEEYVKQQMAQMPAWRDKVQDMLSHGS